VKEYEYMKHEQEHDTTRTTHRHPVLHCYVTMTTTGKLLAGNS